MVRVDGIDAGGFWLRVQEWDYLDGTHTTETVDYLVMERGRHQLTDGSWVEAGRLETDATNAFVPVAFGQPFAATPVVLASVTTVNDDVAVATRLREIDVNGFQVGLREQESNPQSHAAEAIDYIAWQPSSGVLDGLRFEVGRTGDEVTDDVHTISYQGAFDQPPVVLVDMQSTDGGDTANLRWQNKSSREVECMGGRRAVTRQ